MSIQEPKNSQFESFSYLKFAVKRGTNLTNCDTAIKFMELTSLWRSAAFGTVNPEDVEAMRLLSDRLEHKGRQRAEYIHPPLLSSSPVLFYSHSFHIPATVPTLSLSPNQLFQNKCCHLQGITIRQFPSLVNFVAAVAYHFCLNLPATFSQPENGLIVKLKCRVASNPN